MSRKNAYVVSLFIPHREDLGMKKTLAIVLVVLCTLSIFAQGAKEAQPTTTTTTTTTTAVYATASFGMKFSPFFAATAYDQDIVDMTQISSYA